MKNETEIFPRGNIESVVNALLAAKARGESVYAKFYDHIWHSDTISMD